MGDRFMSGFEVSGFRTQIGIIGEIFEIVIPVNY